MLEVNTLQSLVPGRPRRNDRASCLQRESAAVRPQPLNRWGGSQEPGPGPSALRGRSGPETGPRGLRPSRPGGRLRERPGTRQLGKQGAVHPLEFWQVREEEQELLRMKSEAATGPLVVVGAGGGGGGGDQGGWGWVGVGVRGSGAGRCWRLQRKRTGGGGSHFLSCAISI